MRSQVVTVGLVVAFAAMAFAGFDDSGSLRTTASPVAEEATPECSDDFVLEETDHFALKNLFAKLNGKEWSRKDKWGTDESFCTWEGVTCQKGRVVALDLGSNNMFGDVPEDLGLLTQLQTLDISGNSLKASTISAFGALTKMENLNVSDLQCSFKVADLVNALQRLQTIILDNVTAQDETFGPFFSRNLKTLQVNNLKGKNGALTKVVFDELHGLPKLETFIMNSGAGPTYQTDLDLCKLIENAPAISTIEASGTLSASHFDLKCLNGTGYGVKHIEASYMAGTLQLSTPFPHGLQLNTLILTGSTFSSDIFTYLHRLTKLKHIDFSNCGLTGIMPMMYDWKNFEHLEVLRMSGNSLIGGIGEVGGISTLVELDLSKNKFSGGIVDVFSSPNIKHVNLKNNEFFGPLPSSMKDAIALESLDLSGNRLDICVGPDSLKGQLPALKYLSLSGGNCEVAPEGVVNLPALEELDLQGSNIKVIPEVYGSFKALKTLTLNNNKIEGLPSSIGDINTLEVLNLSENELKSVPKTITNLNSLTTLKLNKNKMKSLAFALKSLIQASGWVNSMKYMDLSDNELAGESLDGFAYLSKLEELYISNSKADDSLNSYLWFSSEKLTSLRVLDLSKNAIDGKVPAYINEAASLRVLNLSSNKFSGNVPKFPENSKLEQLLLNNNEFTGSFPFELEDGSEVTSIRKLNLQHNQFSGELPSVAKFARMTDCNISENSFENKESWQDSCQV